jgi:hypothetical protein
MKHCRNWSILLACLFAAALLLIGCVGSSVDTSKLLGNLTLPPKESNTQWTVNQKDSSLTLNLRYNDTTLLRMLKFMQSLVDNNWYLTENQAFKGNRSLEISYDFEAQKLQLAFVQSIKQVEWPDVLTPYLAHVTPVFPFGTYTSYEKREIQNVESAAMLIYNNVSTINLTAYEKTLIDNGYIFDSEKNGQRFFKKDKVFVTLTHNAQTQQAAIIVGKFLVYYVALPPWPDPLPESIKRILPTVAAQCKVEELDGGYKATAENLTIAELYQFIQSASLHYGWSELNDKGEISHSGTLTKLKVVYFNTTGNKLVFNLFTAIANTPTPSATLSPTPSPSFSNEGFDDGMPGYDFRLTTGYYSDEEAMNGVLAEFGQTVEVANWEEIKALYSNRFNAFLNYAGVKVNEDVWLLYKKSGYDGNRHYFLARIAGVPRANFKLYDSVGNEAWLGSWYGIKLRVLIKVPVK